MTNNSQLQFSLFNSVTDNNPTPLSMDWAELLEFCREPKIVPNKNSNGLFSPAVFSTARRIEANVIGLSALVLDVDHNADLHETWNYIREWGYAALVYTSYRHQNPDPGDEPEDKFRIILPLAAHCDPATYPALWEWANNELNGILDPACKNANRIFYWPARANENAPYFTASIDGDWLDWRTLLLPLTSEQQAEPPAHPRLPVPDNYKPQINDAGAMALYERKVHEAVTASNGNKWLVIRDGAYCLGGLVGAGRLDANEAENALFNAIVAAGAKDHKHARKTIHDAIQRGAMFPLYPSIFTPTMTQFPVRQVTPEMVTNDIGEEVPEGYHMEFFDEDLDGTIAWLAEDNKRCAASTGFEGFDNLFRPRRPALTIVTGQPNAGKSNWLDALMVSLALKSDWHFSVVSFETQPIRMHRLMIAGFVLRKYYRTLTAADLQEAAAKVGKNFAFHIVPPKYRTASGVLRYLGHTCAKHRIDAIVFDPFTELDLSSPGYQRQQEQQTAVIGAALTDMKNFAYERDLHFFLVVHPSKNSDRSEAARSLVLTLEDSSGSKHFDNKADYGLTVHREITEDYDKTSVHVTKVRRGYPGRKGCQYFDYQVGVGDYIEGNPPPKKSNGRRNFPAIEF